MKDKPTSSGPAADPKRIVNELAAGWACLSLAADVERLVDLYSSDAIFFGSLPRMFIGHAGIAEYFETISLALLKSVRFDWQQAMFITPSVINAGGLVYFGMEIEGKPTNWRFGISWVLFNTAAGWKISAHHASPREL